LQAMGAMPPTTAPQMVILPASVGNGSVMSGSWPQQYVVVPGLNQFVLAASDASSSSAQAVLLASLGAHATPGVGSQLTTDLSQPRSLSSPVHMLNGMVAAQTIASTQPALSTIAENQLSQPAHLPKPPVKPLSAYMSFSKAVSAPLHLFVVSLCYVPPCSADICYWCFCQDANCGCHHPCLPAWLGG